MTGQRFTRNETVLCAYAAMYNAADVGGCALITAFATISTGRPESSIPAKIRNIAGTLDKYVIPRNRSWNVLTGTTTGQKARETDWKEVIEPLTRLPHREFLEECLRILSVAFVPVQGQ